MSRRIAALAALALATAVAAVPADAATKAKPKPKPKDLKGSYTLNLNPDPTINVTAQVFDEGCNGLIAASEDNHPLTVPAAGKLYIHLVSADPTGRGLLDWDLWLKETSGKYIGASHDGTADEEITLNFKKKTPVVIEVCNLGGMPAGKVDWVFKYA